MSFKLGSKAKDTVTGFRGTIVQVSQHICGYTQYELQAGFDKDGKWVDSKWFSESRLAAVKGDKPVEAPPADEPEAEETPAEEEEGGFGEAEEEAPEAEEVPETTMDDVIKACQAHAKKTSREKTNAILLTKFKVKSVKSLKSTQFAAVVAAMAVKK